MARRRWTSQEDGVLTDLIRRYGDKRGREGRWHDIANCLPGRTAKDCRKRWFHSLDPSLRKGRWTEEEDRILQREFSRLGPAWKQISLLLPGRKDDQCAKRYTEILAPSVNRRLQKWTPEEDAYLRIKVQELGHSWSIISAGLPGRPPLTCRNRWRALSKNKTQSPDSGSVPNVLPQFLIPDNENDADAVHTVPHQHPRSASQTDGTGAIPPLDIQALESFLDGSDFNLDIAEFDTMQPSDAGYQSALPDISLSACQNNDIRIPFPEVGNVDEHQISEAWGLHNGTEHLISQTSMNHNQTSVLSVASPVDPGNAQFSCTAITPADSLDSTMHDAGYNDPATSTSSPEGLTPTSSGSDVDSGANASLPREPPVGAGRSLHSQNSSTVHVHHHVHHHHYHYHYYP